MQKTKFFVIMLLLLNCTGEIESLWIIEWKLSYGSSELPNDLSHQFKLDISNDISFFDSSIDSAGNLYERFYISELSESQVKARKPNVEFKLLSGTSLLIDTVFTWQEMEFVGNVSEKEIIIP